MTMFTNPFADSISAKVAFGPKWSVTNRYSAIRST